MRVIHTAMWVSDLEATRAFYEDVLGLDFHREFTTDGVTNYYVGSDDGAELQFKHRADESDPVTPDGVDHVAVGVDDVDATFERVVEETGCPVVLEPTTIEAANSRAAFVEDPDGYTVEFVAGLDA